MSTTSIPLVLMVRLRRSPAQPAHVETFWHGGVKQGKSLCGILFTDERVLASFDVGSEKDRGFWQDAVCAACKIRFTEMDK